MARIPKYYKEQLTTNEEQMIGHLQAGDYQGETPSGSVDGSNKEFTLSAEPSPASSLFFIVNGSVLKGDGNDFTLSGDTVTMTWAPASGSNIITFFLKDS